MLRQLEVINYGLIDKVKLSFERGFTAITGETGSGKSILLGAFGLLTGERAESKSIKFSDQKCIVEAEFEIKSYGLEEFFKHNDLDFEELTVIRREIAPGGKSRAFINDTPVNIAVLKSLGERLVDVHSQHQNSILSERDFQFSILDAFGKTEDALNAYRVEYSKWKEWNKRLSDLKDSEARLKQELDYHRFQLQELVQAQLEELDKDSLESEQDTLANAEQIRLILSQSVESIVDESGVQGAISQIKSSLQKVSSYHHDLKMFHERMESILIELKDLTHEMEHFSGNISSDPARLQEVEDKLALLFHLQQKHRLTEVSQLIDLRNQLEEKVRFTSNLDEEIIQLENEISKLNTELHQRADEISLKRVKAAKLVTSDVLEYFKKLALENAEISFEVSESNQLNSFGKNEVKILFKANAGGSFQPIQNVASGGEISRVMLALKASITKHKKLPVLILDEIDQGVSGEVGKRIGAVLKEMSEQLQLMAITHLPQIAGRASHQFKVFKTTDGQSTTTEVTLLKEEERVKEIAEMLSGKNISDAALTNARELMV